MNLTTRSQLDLRSIQRRLSPNSGKNLESIQCRDNQKHLMIGQAEPEHLNNDYLGEEAVENNVCREKVVSNDAEGLSKRESRHQITFPSYPTHGVIGSLKPSGMNAFSKPDPNNKDFKKQKFDFYETYESHLNKASFSKSATPLPGLGYLQRGLKTTDVYDIDPTLPFRFRNPDLFKGYGYETGEHPLFKTTTSEYGRFAPTVHDVPHEYHGLKNTFTKHLSSAGMPRNRSLNIK